MTVSSTVLALRVAGCATVATALVLAVACSAAPPADTRAADEEAVRKTDADWAKAAQSKSMDAMLDVSETVSVACSKCHEPYRDFDDQKQRCTPVEKKAAAE